jgi:hypothetical protein
LFEAISNWETSYYLWCASRALKSEPEQTFFMIFGTGQFLRGFRV